MGEVFTATVEVRHNLVDRLEQGGKEDTVLNKVREKSFLLVAHAFLVEVPITPSIAPERRVRMATAMRGLHT